MGLPHPHAASSPESLGCPHHGPPTRLPTEREASPRPPGLQGVLGSVRPGSPPGLATGWLCGLGRVIWPQPQFPRLLGCCEYIKQPAHSRCPHQGPASHGPARPSRRGVWDPSLKPPSPCGLFRRPPAAHKPLSFDLSSFRRAGRDGASSQPSPSASSPPYTSGSINLCTPPERAASAPACSHGGAHKVGLRGRPAGQGPRPRQPSQRAQGLGLPRTPGDPGLQFHLRGWMLTASAWTPRPSSAPSRGNFLAV